MTKKQKKVLIRIIVAAILLVILHFVPLEGMWLGLLYLIPYAVIGYDILRKAILGIMHGESGFMFLKGARRRADYAVPIQRGRTSLSILLTGGGHMEYHDGQGGTPQKQINRQSAPAQEERGGKGTRG